MTKILFQGDSITDAGRNREAGFITGWGYPTLVASRLGYENPCACEFINRGIGGNRISDLVARMKCDIINLQPDVMSILIGVNDVWHELSSQNGTGTALFETLYDLLITEVKQALPNIRILIMEPFVLKGPATEEKWEDFRDGVAEKAAAARRVAEKHGLEFIPLQEKLNEATTLAPSTYWLRDGVHPSEAGHELLAREWIKTFTKA